MTSLRQRLLQLADDDIYQLWRWGHNNDRCFISMRPLSERRRYIRLEKLSLGYSGKRLEQTFSAIKNHTAPSFEAVPNSPKSKREVEFLEWQQELKRSALNAIHNGTLFGLGFVVPRGIDDIPTLVPPDLWRNIDLGFKSNEFKRDGLKIVDVKVCYVNWLNKFEETQITTGSPQQSLLANPVGRPSKALLIEEAFYIAANTRRLNLHVPMNSNYPVIRDIIQKYWPDEYADGKGLGEEAMRKVISPLFKEELKRHQRLSE